MKVNIHTHISNSWCVLYDQVISLIQYEFEPDVLLHKRNIISPTLIGLIKDTWAGNS